MPGHSIRIATLVTCLAVLPAASGNAQSPADYPAARVAEPRDGSKDFDWEFGSWKTQLSRRLRPLTGSTTWAQYEGTTVVRPVMNGRANLVEFDASGPGGHIEAISLRLYDPATRQWSLNFASMAGGGMGAPVVGEFRNGHGEFYGADTLNGRAILVRFVISKIDDRSWRFEQAFSDDGGRNWEVNWIVVDTRVS